LTAPDFTIEVMDQMKAYGSGLTGPCTLVAKWDLDNYALKFPSGSLF